MLEVGGLIYQHFWTREKIEFFKFLIGAKLAYKINPIKFYKEWWNRNTVKILFCKVKFVKFSIKDVKMIKKKKKKKKKMATLPIFSTL